MNDIQKSVEIFERLRKFKYRISIEDGTAITLRFSREHFHHLAGFQHLTDMPDIAQPKIKDQFYNQLRKGKISTERITESVKYAEIEERIRFFSLIEDILETGKIIVEFDPNKTDTVIEARFHLFLRDGNPFTGEAVYYTLFLDRDNGCDYFPVTYVVEHSNTYVKGQQMYECTIEKILSNRKKALVKV